MHIPYLIDWTGLRPDAFPMPEHRPIRILAFLVLLALVAPAVQSQTAERPKLLDAVLPDSVFLKMPLQQPVRAWERSGLILSPSFLHRPNQLPTIRYANSLLYAQIPRLDLPPVPQGFFCRWEDNLAKKSPFPIDFGTD